MAEALDTFDFPYHSFNTENPDSGFRVQFGGSYIFSVAPTDPDQRVFTLTFGGMQYFTNPAGDLDATVNPQRNMFTLIKFYQQHKLYKSFKYQHPVHGLLEVKFNKPLKEEVVVTGGYGVVKEFSIELLEIP